MRETASGDPLPAELAAAGDLPEKLMVFDGICVLCSRAVRFVIEHEKVPAFHFAPVQSDLGQRVLRATGQPPDGNNSMVIVEGGRYYLKSDGILRLSAALKAPWSWAVVLRRLPRHWRDRAYDRLARNRFRIFGRYDSCMVPDPALLHRFRE